MTKGVIVPLESYRLAQYAMPINCYICDGENTVDAEFCGNCAAPMALAHQADGHKVLPRMVAVLGASGVGKTVYLGMLLDMLSRQPQHLQLLARGAFSITLQQTTLRALSRCEFPQKTPNEPDRWNWVHCQIRRPRQRQFAELIMPDMAGEAVLEEVDHPHTYRVIRAFLKKCTAAMVLVDTVDLQEGGLDQNYFTMKLLTYLSELDDDPKAGWPQKPIALVFSKADRCDECMADPTGYARTHATGLWQHCQERFLQHEFFAASVCGACATIDTRKGKIEVPLRVEPRGVVEPFEWLLEKIKLGANSKV